MDVISIVEMWVVSSQPLTLICTFIYFEMDPFNHTSVFGSVKPKPTPLTYLRLLSLVGFYIPCFYSCCFMISLNIFWITLYTSVSMLSYEHSLRCKTVVDLYNEVQVAYSMTRSTMEPLISFGISAMWNVSVLFLGVTMYLFLEVSFKVGSLFIVITGALVYGFVCAMGLVAQSNQISKCCLRNCFSRASLGDKMQKRIVMKRIKACRALSIACKPVGQIDRHFQADYVHTIHARVVDIVLIFKRAS